MNRILITTLCLFSASLHGTSFQGSILNGDENSVAIEISEAKDLNVPIGENQYPLVVAIAAAQESIAVQLVEAGARLSKTPVPFHELADYGLGDLIVLIAEKEPNHVCAGSFGLARAAVSGYFDSARKLLNLIAPCSIGAKEIQDAIDMSIGFRNEDITQLILDSDYQPSPSALFVAVRFGTPGLVRRVIEYGVDANITVTDTDGSIISPADFLKERLSRDYESGIRIARELASAGADLDMEILTAMGKIEAVVTREIRDASKYGYLTEVDRWLSAHGCDSGEVYEALHTALDSKSLATARSLLMCIPVGMLDSETLWAAMASRSPGIVRLVLERAGISAWEHESGISPIAWWLRQGGSDIQDVAVLQELMRAGLNDCPAISETPALRPYVENRIRPLRWRCKESP